MPRVRLEHRTRIALLACLHALPIRHAAGPEEHDYQLDLEFYSEVDDKDIKQVCRVGGTLWEHSMPVVHSLPNFPQPLRSRRTPRSASSRW